MLKKIKLYQVDAFTAKVFGGNPAAVCVLDEWLDEDTMQKIATENNLSETAFVVPKGADFEIRWFTPLAEVALCGHATLASAFVLFNFYDQKKQINFHSRASGILPVEKKDDWIVLDFPADLHEKVDIPKELLAAFNIEPVECYKGKTDYLLLFSSQKQIEALRPDFNQIIKSGVRGVIVSAQGDETDFVSRFFAPKVGVNEDPVTGSAHTTLIPFWSKKLGKKELTARQLSKRQGDLLCEYLGDRVKMKGKGICYLKGEIEI